MVTVVLRN